ncbi:hypothetical protein [Jiella sonneratiae]|uniref:Lipoprotein n=1 Tax=Jiella sonneratiae TaxID=2816856 RepID=A0ABS3J955_9HYPH|nr:hypothetical protein [Jiella sonneratiae]MBO0906210.1 hypothetical protein [Jiella sonneratiae]
MLAFLAAIVCGGGGGSRAATLTTDAANSVCLFRLTGRIERDDVAAIRSRLTPLDALDTDDTDDNKDRQICLDSPGGNFGAALDIGTYLFEQSYGTVVEEGASCLSACAVIFMFGNVHGEEFAGFRRKLHIRGRLGFHAVSPVLPPGPYPSEAVPDLVRAAFAQSSQVAGMIVEAVRRTPGLGAEPMMRDSLVVRMLTTDPSRLFMVETVDQFGRWHVDPLGLTMTVRIGRNELVQACRNALVWTRDGDAALLTDEVSSVETRPVSGNAEAPLESTVALVGFAELGCRIRHAATIANGALVEIETNDEFTGVKRLIFANILYFLPPDTLMRNLR